MPELEADFLVWVIDYAQRVPRPRWWVMHPRPAQTSSGWRTPTQGDGAGWPDLVLVRDRLIVAELKAAGRYLEPAQRDWRDRLIFAGVEWHLWRPADRDRIAEALE
jgi:hypothetical protein